MPRHVLRHAQHKPVEAEGEGIKLTSIIDLSVIKIMGLQLVCPDRFLEGLGPFVLKWCQTVLPVLSGVRIYINEPGGIDLVHSAIVIYIYLSGFESLST